MKRIIFLLFFFSLAAHGADKVKIGFISTLSGPNASIGTDIRDARGYVRTMQELGMPLYQCQPPTGYADTADAWINTGALVARMNVATRIIHEHRVEDRRYADRRRRPGTGAQARFA